MNQVDPGRGLKKVNTKFSLSGINPIMPSTFPEQKEYQGVKRFENIISNILTVQSEWTPHMIE